MKKILKFVIFAAINISIMSGCTKSDDSKKSDITKTSVPNNETPEKGEAPKDPVVSENDKALVQKSSSTSVEGLSETAKNNNITIKRLRLGSSTMDVFNANPKRANRASQKGSLTLAFCGPRLTDRNLSDLEGVAYPIVITGNSQVLIQRDTTYKFGDGTNASSVPPYVLMTCEQGKVSENKNNDVLSSTVAAANIQVKNLSLGSSTMEVLDPNPKGAGNSSQPGVLTLVSCGPRITDVNLEEMNDTEYPIMLTEGSQLALRRDTSYQFGDGTNASSATPQVIITCGK